MACFTRFGANESREKLPSGPLFLLRNVYKFFTFAVPFWDAFHLTVR